MATFNLRGGRYQAYLGRSFWERQVSNISDALPAVIKKGLATTPKAPPPGNPGLPDVSDIDKPKSNLPLYLGLGMGALVLITVLKPKRPIIAK